MSRGFVREDDQEEAPFIPPRAPLPPGTTNYVTRRGLRLLHEERAMLEAGRNADFGSDDERRRALVVINGKLDLLAERITSARVVEQEQRHDEVRFGVTVTVRVDDRGTPGMERRFTIVGVDEASVAEERIAFTAPIARALLGHRAGDVVEFVLGPRKQRLTLLAIASSP